jgi:hypothetical protein
MHFFRDSGVSSVLKSSCITYTFRFCARWLLGQSPRPTGQPSAVVSAALRLLALTKKSLFLEAPLIHHKYVTADS